LKEIANAVILGERVVSDIYFYEYATNILFLLNYNFQILRTVARLPILMYHNITPDASQAKGLTLSTSQLESQLSFLQSAGYRSWFLSEIEQQTQLTGKNVVITFDDVTVNQFQYAVPLLEKYGMKAQFFVPFAYLGKTDAWNYDGEERGEPIMTAEQLRQLNPEVIELGHHSYLHRHFATLDATAIQDDFKAAFEVIEKENLHVFPAIAYPYGNYPKKDPQRQRFFEQIASLGMRYGLRIGNNVSAYPFANPFEIKRIDIKGEDTLWKFKWKLRLGKVF
jgi:peptidoglycan/xylan/chitin deacetylase (PgdA/CDA1 family)